VRLYIDRSPYFKRFGYDTTRNKQAAQKLSKVEGREEWLGETSTGHTLCVWDTATPIFAHGGNGFNYTLLHNVRVRFARGSAVRGLSANAIIDSLLENPINAGRSGVALRMSELELDQTVGGQQEGMVSKWGPSETLSCPHLNHNPQSSGETFRRSSWIRVILHTNVENKVLGDRIKSAGSSH